MGWVRRGWVGAFWLWVTLAAKAQGLPLWEGGEGSLSLLLEERARWEIREDADFQKEAEDRKAMDEKIKLATDSLRAEFRDAEEARRDVRPVVGDVIAMDSAADIYTFALDQMKVDHKDVSGVANLRALFKAAKSAAAPPPRVAFDGAGIEEKFPGASRSLNVL